MGSGLTWEHHRSGLLVVPQESIQRWQEVLLRLVNCDSFGLIKGDTPDGSATTPDDAITILLSIVIAIERPMRELSILSLDGLDLSRVDERLLRNFKFFAICCPSLEALTFGFSVEEAREVVFVVRLIQYAETSLQRLTSDFFLGECSARLVCQLSLMTRPPLRLQELNLIRGHVFSDEYLIKLLAFFKRTLTKISFSSFTNYSGGWAVLLKSLSKFPSLTEISISQPSGYTVQGRCNMIHFPALLRDPVVDPVLGTKFSYTFERPPGRPATVEVQYSGPSMDIALQKLAESATFM
ncbi:hypothetical protein AbraIFM66950_006261 [Aspergillus brasiliensis]|nr:hypothetical protein AbraIFM66950_006261 [Aspergillus brasiliensis]